MDTEDNGVFKCRFQKGYHFDECDARCFRADFNESDDCHDYSTDDYGDSFPSTSECESDFGESTPCRDCGRGPIACSCDPDIVNLLHDDVTEPAPDGLASGATYPALPDCCCNGGLECANSICPDCPPLSSFPGKAIMALSSGLSGMSSSVQL